ncbi:ATP/GTP-binding protein [Streptomyces sp. NPDC056628]|uniref:ATP/GTP-binding protein n=1 Tax=Streptomyces sp. NPDC056628 TaxID=3345882 RepID=UPI00369A9EDD
MGDRQDHPGESVMLTRRLIMSATVCLAAIATAPAARASDGPDISTGNCDLISFCVGIDVPGSGSGEGQGGGTDSGSGNQASGSSGSAPKCTMKKMDPQPPPGSIFYEGEGKVVYLRTCPDSDPNTPDNTVSVGVPPGEDPPTVDAEVLAQRAVDSMTLLGPDIASPRGFGKYTVGVPMWMWVNQSATTYGPNTASASAGGITVTATAKVSKIVWQMGDGASVTCNGPGTPYTSSEGMAPSPTCGHVYSKTSTGAQRGRFPVTATSTWTIDWQGGGQAGQLTEVRNTNVQVAVGEVQVVR